MTTLKTYQNYKNSGVGWFPNVPSDWKINRGKFYFQNKKSINSAMNCDNVLSLTMRGVIHREELGEGGLLPTSYDTFQIFEKDNLVFKLIDLENYRTSRVGIVPERGIMSSAYIRIEARNSGINPRYFYWQYFNLYLQGIYNFLGMGVRSTLNYWDLLELPIVIPDEETQKRIATFLDERTKTIDELIAKKEKLIELLREKRQSLITQVVTRGLDPKAKMKSSGIEWIGDAPKEWNILPFRSLFSERHVPNTNGIVNNVLSLSYGRIVDRDVESNFGLLPASFDTYQIIEAGWIIFRLTDLQNDHKSLRTALASKRGIITSAYLAVESTKNIRTEYASYLLHAYDLRKVFYSMGGGIRQSIDYVDLKWMPILVPPTNEQDAIVGYLDIEVVKIDKATSLITQQIQQLKEYRSSLIYSAVTGKTKI